MDEVTPRNPSIIRKSAFGRTSLFIPSTDVLLREIQCMGGVTRYDNVSVYHHHNMTGKDVACWHCCETFDGESLQVPRLFDPVEKIYHVYGNFCSANCGKAYIIENSTYDRGQHLNVFVRMLRDVYGIREKVIEAPPRVSLKRFGGPFNIEKFRTMKNICSICKPPFVSYCMVVEERNATKATDKHELFKGSNIPVGNTDEDISNIPEVGMYDAFMHDKSDTSKVAEPLIEENVKKTRKRKEKDHPQPSVNTLANYK